MKIKEIISILDQMSPLAYAEDFDNVGLLVGNQNEEVSGVLVCHDALETVVDEAINKNCNLIVCFHPILFSGIKKITGKNYVERSILKAIKNDIAIFAIHTALDNHQEGVNKIFCDALGLINTKILIPKQNFIQKLITYTTLENSEKLKNSLFEVGAGKIGNYENCSFSSNGNSTFCGNENSNTVVGNRFELVENEEIKIEVIFEKHLQSQILKALFSNHIYEEVAYEIYNLENLHQNIGLGMIGELENEIPEKEFLEFVKQKMQAQGIRHSEFLNKKVKKVAVLGGSGSSAIKNAIVAGADVFLTADLKYHNFYEAENQILLADIGHFESERYTKNYIYDYLTKKIINFANSNLVNKIYLSDVNTNPVKYL
jgi:dinuclear metal center YbgI/SA1388 family protein